MRALFPLVAAVLPLITGIIAAPLDDVVQPFVDEKIPNAWIVQLKEEASSQSLDGHLSWLSTVTKEVTSFAGTERKYDFAGFVGYSGQFDADTVEQIRARPEVALVEPDGVVNADKLCVKQALPMPGLWGLGRISFRPGGNRGIYLYNNSSPYCNSRTGAPTAYLLDSGVYSGHHDFGGRATHLWKANPLWPSDDLCGHGTHVAGTLIGRTYGVAKNAIIFSVKVLERSRFGSCSGTWAGVIAGVEQAYKHASGAGKIPLSVINMSLGGGLNPLVNSAVQAVVSKGLTVVVSAGNAGEDACQFSPASAPGAITVAASNTNDTLASFSNNGCCVDIHAPGVGVLSAWTTSRTATNTFSGTSMAAPHVAGLILYKKCLVATLRTPKKDREELVRKGVPGIIVGNLCIQGSSQKCCSPNLLANNGGCP
ncbi:subtilisin-like protein [Tuber magnatum]|uniref:Subtilisin-like protein n=1 Tax=Tuber magnatum TaxID=42249 RepID=A0A317T2V8_9PEZI|nr:subtilisin-like protein [Tuber magnatum]